MSIGGHDLKRFMVCDDDVAFVEKTAQMLHELYEACSVEHMYGPEALEASLREDSSAADVLLVDIELRSKNSIELIRRYLKPSSPMQVIYVTGYIHYCSEVYDTKHSSFLVKPLKPESLQHAVELAYRSLERDQKSGISIKTNGGIRIIYAPSLLYVESHGRCLSLVTDGERIETYEKLKDFQKGLDKRFVICHKSFLVNLDHVRQFCGNSFLMEDGTIIPISEAKRKSVREYFIRYIGGIS